MTTKLSDIIHGGNLDGATEDDVIVTSPDAFLSKVECDVCGFDFYKKELVKRWDGAMVCKKDYDSPHPRDSQRGGR